MRLRSLFTHPERVCMTYANPFMFSMYISGCFIKGAFLAIIHAIIPDIFIRSTTETVDYVQTLLLESGCRSNIEDSPSNLRIEDHDTL